MSLDIFLHSFTATFFLLFAVGPICMTVINTTIMHGFRIGIFAGLGVACADTIYIVVASLTMNMLEEILNGKVVIYIGLTGGLFLYYLAYKFWITRPALDESRQLSGNKLKSFISLFFLTLTGPTTILTYSIVFSSFLGDGNFDPLSAIIGGVCGTFLFYLLLTSIISVVRRKMNEKAITILSRIATIVIATMSTLLIVRNLKLLFV